MHNLKTSYTIIGWAEQPYRPLEDGQDSVKVIHTGLPAGWITFFVQLK